jgi:hypothetical protein
VQTKTSPSHLRTINELAIFSTHGCTLFMEWMLVITHPNLWGTDIDIHCLMMQLRDLSEYRNIDPCDARRPRGYGLWLSFDANTSMGICHI